MKKTDFDSVIAINQASIPGVFPLHAVTFSELLELCEYARVIEVEKQIAGYIFAMGKGLEYDGEEYNWFCENRDEAFLYVDQIAIGSEWKGMGCGKRLYRDLENYAVQNCKSLLTCEVNCNPPNPESLAFHRKMGFTETVQLAPRGKIVSLMEKRELS